MLLVVAVVVIALAGCSGDDDSDTASDPAPAASLTCEWPMWGHDEGRPFAYPAECETELAPETVPRLREQWFHPTDDVVTATPAVVDGTVYVGDWSGTFSALALEDGTERWTFQAPQHRNVYSGQIVGSAAVADVGGERRVFVPSGKTLYALRASDGELLWEHELNPEGDANDPTEIQSSPVVVDTADGPVVIFGFDGHDIPGVRAGLIALDAEDGTQRWYFDPDRGEAASGCVGIWGSPTVDVERGLVFAGTANCPTSPEGWRDHSEAIFAVDLETGVPEWQFQPRGPSNNDFDFAGAPNLFTADGQDVVGLGGKDGVYYALDRGTGELVWKVEASTPRVQAPNFSTGGFIGAAAVQDGIIVGGTAVDGPCPCLHGIATTGTIAWQQEAASATFASSAIVNGVAFSGSTIDFTLRAVDAKNGAVLWSHEMVGSVAGGVAIVDDWVIAVAGIREPGLEPAGTKSGISGFTLASGTAPTTTTPETAGTLPPTPTAPPEEPAFREPAVGPACLASACSPGFTLVSPPPGTTPELTLRLTPNPFRIEVRAAGLGDPAAWIRSGSVSAEAGAVAYGVFVSDDSLSGALLCVLDEAFDCVNEDVPSDATSRYNRVTILAITDTPELPTPADGAGRIVTTVGLSEPVEFEQ